MKLKAKRDPDQPKKPKTSYMYFCQAKRAYILKENSSMLLGDQSKKLGHLWNSLTDEEKKPYIQQAGDDRSRYDEEIEDYNDKWS